MFPLLDAAGDGTGGGTATGGDGQSSTAGAAGAAATTTGQGASGASASSQGNGAPPSQTTGFTYQEDRSRWIPPHRLNEVSQRAKDFETENGELKRRLNLALGGGDNTSPDAAKQQAIRDAFFALPGMNVIKRLVERLQNEGDVDRLLDTPHYADQARASELQRWERHGNETIDAVSDSIAEALGVDTLDDDQKADVRQAFSAFVKKKSLAELNAAVERYGREAVDADNRRYSETIRRYEASDPKLRAEFATRYTKSWVEPSRRSATARTANRTRPVPTTGNRNPVTSIRRPDKFKTLDEALDFATGVAKEQGLFGGR